MNPRISSEQKEQLRTILKSRAPALVPLIETLVKASLSSDDVQLIRMVLSDKLIERGLRGR